MPKSNKELAVELYSAILMANATLCSNPNFKGTVSTPTLVNAAHEVQILADLLESVRD